MSEEFEVRHSVGSRSRIVLIVIGERECLTVRQTSSRTGARARGRDKYSVVLERWSHRSKNKVLGVIKVYTCLGFISTRRVFDSMCSAISSWGCWRHGWRQLVMRSVYCHLKVGSVLVWCLKRQLRTVCARSAEMRAFVLERP